MATNLSFNFVREADPTAATILVNGNEVYSGAIGSASAIGDVFTLEVPTDLNQSDTASISISTTSGILLFASVSSDTIDYPDFRISSSILINGQPPEWPATPVVPMPGGTEQDPDWTGWFFELGAGETLTCNILVDNPIVS